MPEMVLLGERLAQGHEHVRDRGLAGHDLSDHVLQDEDADLLPDVRVARVRTEPVERAQILEDRVRARARCTSVAC